MKSLKNYFLIALLGVALLAGCRSDDDAQECPTPCDDPTNSECPNYDPCFGENPVTAAFSIYDNKFLSGPNVGGWYEDDVLHWGSVRFRAHEKDAYYKWYLGQEVVEGFGDSIVVRGINDLDPGFYTAALVTQKDANATCFPDDSGRDSTFRFFQVKNVCDLMIMNKFRGVFEGNPTDSVTIELYPAKLGPGNQGFIYDCASGFFIIHVNFGLQSDTLATSNVSRALLDKYYNTGNASVNQVKGFLQVNSDSTCRAEYSLYGIDRVFTGKIVE